MPAAAKAVAPPGFRDDAAATAQRIVSFVRNFSLEATRLRASDLDALKSALPSRTPVYLTAVPGLPASELVESAARLRALGLEPVPHLAVRNLPDAGAVGDLLARLAAQAGVRRVLAIAGDRDRPAGPYGSAIEVIESGLLQRHGIAEVGIAGYPQGHPRIAPDVLQRSLAAKIEAAEQTGLRVHIVTQFAFDATAILNWVARLRDSGIEHPVRIGMAGPTNLSTLLRYAERCGVRASAQGLTRHAGLLKHLIGTSAPDGIIRPLAEACAAGRLGEVTAHFYSFGGAAATGRWAAAVAAGHVVPDRADGFSVEPH